MSVPRNEQNCIVRDKIKSVTVCESYPAQEILKSAKMHNCDNIFMGSHKRGMSHVFVGSVASSVLPRSHVPTLIVPRVERVRYVQLTQEDLT